MIAGTTIHLPIRSLMLSITLFEYYPYQTGLHISVAPRQLEDLILLVFMLPLFLCLFIEG